MLNHDAITIYSAITLLLLIFCFAFTQYKKSHGREIVTRLGGDKLNKIDLKFAETTYTGYTQRGGIFTKASMYYSDSILIFIHDENSLFGSLFNSLPRVIVHDQNLRISIKSDKCRIRIKKSKISEIEIYSDNDNAKLKLVLSEFEKKSKL
jgi:hypothetical protein